MMHKENWLQEVWLIRKNNEEPVFYYSTNKEIATVFSEKQKKQENNQSWKLYEQQNKAKQYDLIKWKEQLEYAISKRNNDDGLSKLRKELEYLEKEYNDSIPASSQSFAIGDWERSLEIYNENEQCIKEFVWSNWTRYDEEAQDLWEEYRIWCEENEENRNKMKDKIDRLKQNIQKLQQWTRNKH